MINNYHLFFIQMMMKKCIIIQIFIQKNKMIWKFLMVRFRFFLKKRIFQNILNFELLIFFLFFQILTKFIIFLLLTILISYIFILSWNYLNIKVKLAKFFVNFLICNLNNSFYLFIYLCIYLLFNNKPIFIIFI